MGKIDEKISELEDKLKGLIVKTFACLEDKYGRALHDIQYGNHLDAIDERIALLESKELLFEVSKLDTAKALCRIKKIEDKVEDLAGIMTQYFGQCKADK